MRKVFAWLGVATLFMVMSRAEAANDVLKPYVVLILDTSGSMGAATGSGPTSCGKPDKRINHAVCAINNIVNSYGEMVFSFGRFRETTTGTGTPGSQTCDANGDQEGNPGTGFGPTLPTPTGGDVCNTQGPYCGDCSPAAGKTKNCTIDGDCTSTCLNKTGESGTACSNVLDDDNDGLVNDGCPVNPLGGTSEANIAGACTDPESACSDSVDNDSDGVINDGCPAVRTAETNCNDSVDDDSDGYVNDGCPTVVKDDDNDGVYNDGCPARGICNAGASFGCINNDGAFEVLTPLVDGNNAVTAKFTDGTCNACNMTTPTATINPEVWGVSQSTFTPLSASLQGAQRYWEGVEQATTGATIWPATTDNTTNNPGFDPINRDPSAAVFLTANDATKCNATAGCTKFTGENPATQCSDNTDDDGDTRVNDGCPAVGGAETSCADSETGSQCTNNTDDDGIAGFRDGRVNDGCPQVGPGPESGNNCTNATDDDGDGVVNDGCPSVAQDDDGDGKINDGCQAWCNGTNCCCVTQCRPYITILLTDGDETCTNFSNTVASVQDLYTVTPRSDRIPVSTLSRSGNVVTIGFTGLTLPYPFKVGDEVFLTGSAIGSLAGTYYTVTTTPNATSLTMTGTASGTVSTITNSLNDAAVIGLRHSASNYSYNVQTIPIGFGISPGYQPIEDIAHAGGAADVPGVNEGYYAQDEADIELAISQILANSVRAESCNEKDDDCDVRIDEDFPTKGQSCTNGLVGACLRTGTLVCTNGGLACNAPTATGTAEICNGIDDNCDGFIDNGITCTSCVPTAEICDGADQDCDGVADQTCRCSGGVNNGKTCKPANGTADCGGNSCTCTQLTQPCGTGTCGGTATCIGGSYQNCTAQTPTTELCDGKDNDCDGICDGFQLGCSEQVSACTSNPASCPTNDSFGAPGHYTAADAAETACNDALDNDLDGLVNDGCPANGAAETGTQCANNTDDDSDGAINDGCPVPTLPIAQNICRPGTRSCPLDAACDNSNSFGICSGEVKACGPDAGAGAGCDICNGLDDDCDNQIDESFVGADCSTNCGIGTTVCRNGNIVCNSQAAGNDATCDNNDDDCDGKVDENWACPDVAPADGQCDACLTDGQGNAVCNGVPKCINGSVVCDGTLSAPETCDCNDNNCNGTTDEEPEYGAECDNATDDNGDGTVNDGCPAVGAAETACADALDSDGDGKVNDGCASALPALCPSGSNCVNCQCAFHCAAGEFPCPLGKKCENTFCVNDPCFNVTCPAVNGNAQTCVPKPNFPNEPQCVDVCSTVSCPSPNICYGPTGECRPNNCLTFPDMCTADQTCIAGTCVSNPCQGVTCDTGKYCVAGTCVSSCADVTCPSGQRCRQGACETDPCGKQCPFGQACNDATGQCIEDPCKFRNCSEGQYCNPNSGQCEDDQCVISHITCPDPSDVCRGGTCLDPDTLAVDAAGETHVTVGGGGCNTTGGSNGFLLAFALGLLLVRRRRTVGGAL